MKYAALILCLALAGCSSAPEPAVAPVAKVDPKPAPVKDHTSIFPDKDKVSTRVVPDHILDLKALPGGSWAEYDAKGKKHQMFIIDTDTNQSAAFMMLDLKAAMGQDPEYLAHMGGYFGTYQGQPLYVFAKTHYLSGIVGMPKDKADPIAIDLAAQLH